MFFINILSERRKMKVELDGYDLVNLVKGIEPNYNVMNNELVQGNGHFVGGFVDRWDWDYSCLKKLSEKDLWELYNICKYSWNYQL